MWVIVSFIFMAESLSFSSSCKLLSSCGSYFYLFIVFIVVFAYDFVIAVFFFNVTLNLVVLNPLSYWARLEYSQSTQLSLIFSERSAAREHTIKINKVRRRPKNIFSPIMLTSEWKALSANPIEIWAIMNKKVPNCKIKIRKSQKG